MKELFVKKCRPGAVLPHRATAGSAGCDLCACIPDPLEVPPGGRVSVPTGIAIEIPDADTAAFVFGRSGLGILHGLAPSNGVGVIDSDYRGEIVVGLTNSSGVPYLIQPGERIAQLVLMPVFAAGIVEREQLSQSGRGEGGLGSTGRMAGERC